MIVVMKAGAGQHEIAQVIEQIEQLGLRSHVIEGTELTVVAAIGEKRDGAKQCPGNARRGGESGPDPGAVQDRQP